MVVASTLGGSTIGFKPLCLGTALVFCLSSGMVFQTFGVFRPVSLDLLRRSLLAISRSTINVDLGLGLGKSEVLPGVARTSLSLARVEQVRVQFKTRALFDRIGLRRG